MWTLISGVIQLIVLIFSKWVRTNEERKKKQEAQIKELGDAIKAGDTGVITSILSGLK